VLRWYDSMLRLHPIESNSDRCYGPVLCVDDELEAVARMLALGLATIILNGKLSPLPDRAYSGITLVGRATALPAECVRTIAERATDSWALVTGIDFAGVAFSAAKLPAVERIKRTPLGARLIDGIAKHVFFVTPAGRVRCSRPLTDNCTEGPRGQPLVFHVHGEGAHADLVHSVLCGRVGPRELGLDGVPVSGGCAETGKAISCKRRNKDHRRIVPFYSLRTTRLVLLTCNGYAPCGETYTSNLSAVLSSLEGYVAEILTTLRPMSFQPELPLTVAESAANGESLSGAVALCEAAARKIGIVDGFVRCGIGVTSTICC
jgi:hypothetical protein